MEPYESRFAALFGADYRASSFWKGRTALYAILQSLELRPNDEVIVPGYTCVVVANAIRHTGAKPVYADIARGTFNLDPASVETRLTARTRALIVQHTYGIPADLRSLQAIAEERRVDLIEDCAHVLPGSKYQDKLLGSFGKAAFFSSQWSKPYTTGLGGMALTQDGELAARLKRIQVSFEKPALLQDFQLQVQYMLYRKLFKPKLYWQSQKLLHMLSRLGILVGSSAAKELIGEAPSDLRWKMGAFQQRVGLGQIGDSKIEMNSAHRQTLSRFYCETLGRQGWRFDDRLSSGATCLLRFPLEVTAKARLLNDSRSAAIELGSWFETPLHPLRLQDHYLVDYQLGSCPVAESSASKVINLPLHERVTATDADRIARFVFSQSAPAERVSSHEQEN